MTHLNPMLYTATLYGSASAAKDAYISALEAYAKVMHDALDRIANLDPREDSNEGFNEWGEADCFRQAQTIAEDALEDLNQPL